MSKKVLKVAELFAGVGGFRLGLENVLNDSDRSAFKVVWSNQWEPATKTQHASIVYEKNFTDGFHSNEDIFEVVNTPAKFQSLQKANPDVVVGGFPCQDYSVAKPLNRSEGLVGAKGVLWWSIYGLLENRIDDEKPVKYLILENVDRLLKSPTVKRGRDFAVMLSSLHKLGYAVEWRIVNAADYGFPQRRRRIFIVAYHQSTRLYKKLESAQKYQRIEEWIFENGVLAKGLPLEGGEILIPSVEGKLSNDPHEVTETYTPQAKGVSRFENSGVMIEGCFWTRKVEAKKFLNYEVFTGEKTPITLGKVISKTKNIPEEYFIDELSIEKWKFFKGAKSVERTKKNGIIYTFDEGGMVFPDSLDKPSRTIITGEGGASPSRFKHVVEDNGRLRRLTPEELEELNGFPREFTKHDTFPDVKRAFFMGNALVVGVVRIIGKALYNSI